MNKYFLLPFLAIAIIKGSAQEVLHLSNGAGITVQSDVELTLQGGITLANGSSLLNNGAIRLKNNSVANISNWTDNSSGNALSGMGLVIFNSDHLHHFSGTTDFYNVQLNAAGNLSLNNHFTVSNQLHLINGKINTGNNQVFLNHNAAASLWNDASNTGYANSWINGNFKRLITTNTNTYDFPVGSDQRNNLLQFLNNNITGTNNLTASFGPKPGTDAGLNVSESGVSYTSVNDGGVWWLVPDVGPTGGNYALQLYFNGFAGLTDNQFGILRRADASNNAAHWQIPPGSSLEAINGSGRLVSHGFARRINISNFSQLGIGMMGDTPCEICVEACTYSQGFYGNKKGVACYVSGGNSTTVSSTQLMLNAFGATTSKVFGNVANKQFFTLYKTDIQNGDIFKMLPGQGNSRALGVDNIVPFDGAYYADDNTWYLVPIPKTGNQKGRINNQLLSQIVTLWFNLQTSATLGAINLNNNVLITTAQTSCGSGIAAGDPEQFVLPNNVVQYLNGGNGYSNDVNGLYQLANDVLGGVNTSVGAAEVQSAMGTISYAFHGCRLLTGTVSSSQPTVITKNLSVTEKNNGGLLVSAFPNPYSNQFHLRIVSPVSGMARIEFFDVSGAKVYESRNAVAANAEQIIPYKGPLHRGVLIYKVSIGNYKANGMVMNPN